MRKSFDIMLKFQKANENLKEKERAVLSCCATFAVNYSDSKEAIMPFVLFRVFCIDFLKGIRHHTLGKRPLSLGCFIIMSIDN